MNEVAPETVCQFSGLYNMTGNKVYTKDLLSFGGGVKAEVYFDNECFSVFKEPIGWDFDNLDELKRPVMFSLSNCEIIGNSIDDQKIS